MIEDKGEMKGCLDGKDKRGFRKWLMTDICTALCEDRYISSKVGRFHWWNTAVGPYIRFLARFFSHWAYPFGDPSHVETLVCYNLLESYDSASREDSCPSDGLKEDSSHLQFSTTLIDITNTTEYVNSHLIQSELCIEYQALASIKHYLKHPIRNERLPLPTVCLGFFLAYRRRSPRPFPEENRGFRAPKNSPYYRISEQHASSWEPRHAPWRKLLLKAGKPPALQLNMAKMAVYPRISRLMVRKGMWGERFSGDGV